MKRNYKKPIVELWDVGKDIITSSDPFIDDNYAEEILDLGL